MISLVITVKGPDAEGFAGLALALLCLWALAPERSR